MKLDWSKAALALGARRGDRTVTDLISAIAAAPAVEVGPLGDRTYFSFVSEGVLMIFEGEILAQVSAYVEAHDGFSSFPDNLPEGVGNHWRETDVLQVLGPANSSGGGRPDSLLGFIHRWLSYQRKGYVLHIEFSQDDKVRKVSIVHA